MKITVQTDGSVDFDVKDTDDYTRVLSILSWWHWEITRRRTSDKLRPTKDVVGTLDFKPRPGGIFTGTESLNAIQYNTWSYLVDHDCEAGVHGRAVADQFNLSLAAAQRRLQTLSSMGYARRISTGRYRAIDSPSQEMQKPSALKLSVQSPV